MVAADGIGQERFLGGFHRNWVIWVMSRGTEEVGLVAGVVETEED